MVLSIDEQHEYILSNQRYAKWRAWKCHMKYPWVEYDDMVSAVNEGMVKAAKKFDPSRRMKFINYAHWYADQELKVLLSHFLSAATLPTSMELKKGYESATLPPIRVEYDTDVGGERNHVPWYNPTESYELVLDLERLLGIIMDILGTWEVRPRIIIQTKLGLLPQYTSLRDLAREWGLSSSRLGQLWQEAWPKFQKELHAALTAKEVVEMAQQVRQGDVLLHPVSKLPKGAKRLKQRTGYFDLAYGEVTGHRHTIELDQNVQVWEAEGKTYIVVEDGIEVHPQLEHLDASYSVPAKVDHGPIPLDPGIYEFRGQKSVTEGWYEEARRLAD